HQAVSAMSSSSSPIDDIYQLYGLTAEQVEQIFAPPPEDERSLNDLTPEELDEFLEAMR
ncbi:hypothetical protein H0H92_011986, partial [Tricholoma furcatifolium]